MIDVCVKCSESNMVEFLGRILCTSAHRRLFLYILVRDCIQKM